MRWRAGLPKRGGLLRQFRNSWCFLPDGAAVRQMGGSGDRTDTIEESGAGEGIRTLDPNLGKVINR